MAKLRIKDVMMDLLEVSVIGTVVFALVYIFVGQLLEVTGDSMYPTLIDKEQIIAEKISLDYKPLERGEIVIFKHPENNERLLVKRVIAVPNDTIMLSNGDVIINGQTLEEPYLENPQETTIGKALQGNIEYKIPTNTYFLMGDNRMESSDSRTFGVVREDLIVGRAFLVYRPLKSFRVIER